MMRLLLTPFLLLPAVRHFDSIEMDAFGVRTERYRVEKERALQSPRIERSNLQKFLKGWDHSPERSTNACIYVRDLLG